MTTAFWCLVIASFIPLTLSFIGDYFRVKQQGGFDNNDPRVQIAKLTGTGGRCYAAQSNAWEALAVFTPAVIVAHLAGVDPETAGTAASIFVVARIFHAGFYMVNQGTLRSLSFVVGWGCCIWLFYLATQV